MEPAATVLEEDIDPDYEPSPSEIHEYALYIGLDPVLDSDLFYIAREGLKAPLPAPWKPCESQDGSVFYFNFDTQESIWEHPCDLFYKEKARELKAAKSKRREIRPNRTPPSGKSSGRESREVGEKRKELERMREAEGKRQEKELEEFKLGLKRQLEEEEKTAKSALKAAKSTEKLENIKLIQRKEEEKLRIDMQQRLLAFKAELNEQLESEKQRLEAEQQQSLAIYEEEARRSAAEDYKSDHLSLDLKIKTLGKDLKDLREAEKSAVFSCEQEENSAKMRLIEERSRLQLWKEEKVREEVNREQGRYEREAAGIRKALEQRISEFMKHFAAPEEMAKQENAIRESAEAKFQQDLEALHSRSNERITLLRRDYDLRLDSAREKAQEQQHFLCSREFEEQKKIIDLQAAQELIVYQRRLDRDLEAEKGRMDLEFRRKGERGSGEMGNREETELRDDGEIRLLTGELERSREMLALKQAQLTSLRDLYEEMKRKKPEKRLNERDRLSRMESELRTLKSQVVARYSGKTSESKGFPLSSKPSRTHIHPSNPLLIPPTSPKDDQILPVSDFEQLKRKTKNHEWPRSIQPLMEQKLKTYTQFLSEESTDRYRLQALLGRQTEWVSALSAALV